MAQEYRFKTSSLVFIVTWPAALHEGKKGAAEQRENLLEELTILCSVEVYTKCSRSVPSPSPLTPPPSCSPLGNPLTTLDCQHTKLLRREGRSQRVEQHCPHRVRSNMSRLVSPYSSSPIWRCHCSGCDAHVSSNRRGAPPCTLVSGPEHRE